MNTKGVVRLFGVCLLVVALGSSHRAQAANAHAANLPADGPTAIVNTGLLNVRAGPSVGYTVVTQVAKGVTVTLLGRNAAATWVNIRLPEGIEGWVNVAYLRADVLIATLPLAGAAALDASATVTVPRLELRAGPGTQFGVTATLEQGQRLTLLGRTSNSAWVKVGAAGVGDGWAEAQVLVRVPGHESGEYVSPFLASIAISSLPVVPPVPTGTSGSARVSLSTFNVQCGTAVYVSLAGFPANRDVAAVLTSPQVPLGFVAARGRTDGSGAVQLFFRMPDMWPSGAVITGTGLSLAVGTTDGAVLLWNGLRYSLS